MVNFFNSVSTGVIFQKLRAIGEDIIQLIPLVHGFYAFESPLFYNHRNREVDVIIIPFAMGTRQHDRLKGGALFVLAHFRALRSIASHFPSCLFPSILNDIHMIGPLLIVSFAYEHFPNRTLCDRSFYRTSKMRKMITF